jgi:predicted RNA-binding protein with PIN domain
LRLDDPEDETQLVSLLRGYLARVKKTGTVVFDRGQLGVQTQLSNRRLKVIFARPPRTADDVLRDLIRRERSPRGLSVVTSDAQVAAVARQAGAAVKDAATFARELLVAPARAAQKEQELSPTEVAEWEEAFKTRRPR